MRFWKDKKGKELTFKEFMGRWKEGFSNITPLQKTKTQLFGTKISLLGVFLGLIISIIGYKNLWWVGLILLGALINMGVQYLGLTQQRDTLVKHEASCEEMSLEDLMQEDPPKKKKTKKKKKKK